MAEAKRIGEDITVNDGGGLLDAEGMIDTLIMDCNSLPKHLIDNQFVKFGLTLAQMVQKLNALKGGIKNENSKMAEIIKDMEAKNRELAEQLYGGGGP